MVTPAPGRAFEARRLRTLRGIGRRVGSLAAVLLVTATLAFIVLESAGGDRVAAILGENAIVTPEAREAIVAAYGLDRPLPVRYFDYIGGLFVGDLGESYAERRPVAEVIAGGLWPTAQLAAGAAVVAVTIALIVGLSTPRSRPLARGTAQAVELVLISTPTFWLGILLIMVFGFGLRLFPVWGDDGFRSLVLPSFALGLPIAAVLAQVVREAADRAEREPFLLSARARGISEFRVRTVHILRFAAGPVLNMTGLVVGGLLGGAVLIETVFGRTGLGTIALDAIMARDLPVVLAVVLIAAFASVVVSMLTDLAHERLDPRIRVSTERVAA